MTKPCHIFSALFDLLRFYPVKVCDSARVTLRLITVFIHYGSIRQAEVGAARKFCPRLPIGVLRCHYGRRWYWRDAVLASAAAMKILEEGFEKFKRLNQLSDTFPSEAKAKPLIDMMHG